MAASGRSIKAEPKDQPIGATVLRFLLSNSQGHPSSEELFDATFPQQPPWNGLHGRKGMLSIGVEIFRLKA
jgi:hypothetical protein